MADWARISRGPKRAPVRYEVPPSNGTPSSATSKAPSSRLWGRRMKVGIPPKRGETKASGGRNSRITPSPLGAARAGAPRLWQDRSRPLALDDLGDPVGDQSIYFFALRSRGKTGIAPDPPERVVEHPVGRTIAADATTEVRHRVGLDRRMC